MAGLADFLAQILNPNPGTNRLANPGGGGGGNYLTQTGLGPEQMARYQQMSGMGGGGMPQMPAAAPAGPPGMGMAGQAPMMPPAQSAPQAPPMAAPAPMGGGGGILGGLRNLFGGGDGGEQEKISHTVNWLESRGYDRGTAQALAMNPPLLQDALKNMMKGPENRQTSVIDGKLVDTNSGEVIGDYGAAKSKKRDLTPAEVAERGYPPGSYQVDEATGDVSSIGGPREQPSPFKNEMELRKEYDMLPEVKDYKVVRSNYERIQQGVKMGTGAGDAAIVFGYMKMLDPTSVVRETEQASARNAAGVPESVRGMWNNLVGGGTISQEARNQILAASEKVYGDSAKNIEDVNARYGELSKAYEIDPSRITSPTEKYDPVGNPVASPAVALPLPPAEKGKPAPGGIDPTDQPPPPGVTPEVWKFVPPESRKLWFK